MANMTNVLLLTDSIELTKVLDSVISRSKSRYGQLMMLNNEEITHNNKDKRYIFDIYKVDGGFVYSTKWTPNIEDMLLVAGKLKAPFTLSSEEFGVDENHYIEFDGYKITKQLDISIYDYCQPDEDYGGVIENKTGDYWESESDFFEYLIEKSRVISSTLLLNNSQICYLVNCDADDMSIVEMDAVNIYMGDLMESNNCVSYTIDTDIYDHPETSINSIHGLIDDNFPVTITFFKQ